VRHETPRCARFATGERVPAGDLFGDATITKDGVCQMRRLLEVGGTKPICDASLSVRRTRSAARVRSESAPDAAADADDEAIHDGGGSSATGGSAAAAVCGGLSAAERLDDRWLQWGVEYYVNPSSLVGLLPNVLLERYVFWRTGTNLVRGYALPEAVGSQLLVRLHRRATSTARHPAASRNDNDDDHDDRRATGLVVADVRRLSDALSADELGRANYGGEQLASDAGELVAGAKVKVMGNLNEFRATYKSYWASNWTSERELLCGKTVTIQSKYPYNDKYWYINTEETSTKSLCVS
jgi:hypothetical protein